MIGMQAGDTAVQKAPFAAAAAAPVTVAALYRFPVKGLSAHPLNTVDLTAGRPLPFDRAYAIENGPGRFDEARPKTIDRISFLMLMRNERLATLDAHFDPADTALTLRRDGRQVARGTLATTAGRAIIEQFLAAYLPGDLRGAPKIRHAEGHSFADSAEPCVHIVNAGSVKELERDLGRPVHALRFRPNIVVSGLQPFEELTWVGRRIAIGGAQLEVLSRTQRCAAINVDPLSARRDLDVLATLSRRGQASDFGVYARVIGSGAVAAGDAVRFLEPPNP